MKSVGIADVTPIVWAKPNYPDAAEEEPTEIWGERDCVLDEPVSIWPARERNRPETRDTIAGEFLKVRD